ncbi:MAG: Fe-S cluster assembly protein SufD [Anaerolineales bacterium]|nr:Fe-S cluster assembly protein SufD [Anaerolineales bacterium]
MRTVSISKKTTAAESNQLFGIEQADIRRISERLQENEKLRALRDRAWKVVQTKPRPSRTDEPWRRTDPARFPYAQVTLGEAEDWRPDRRLVRDLEEAPVGGTLLNHPGQPSQIWLDPVSQRAGVIFTDWATAVLQHTDLLQENLNTIIPVEEEWFSSLTAAVSEMGGLLYVPKGLQIEHPLRSLLWAPGTGKAFFSRFLVIVDEGASVELEHESFSPTEAEGSAFHGGVIEALVRSGGNLKISTVQNWGEHVWDVTHKRIRVERDAKVEWNSAVFGGQTSKDFSDMDLGGDGAEGLWSGIYFSQDQQHFDIDTQQNHTYPHTTSDLLYKGALSGKSRTVWQGMIFVDHAAQQTDGYQANRNLMLSREARADSIPGLEIKADDVRCTHGATAGDVDKEQLYYLMSRGLPREEAKKLVVEGFFSPVLDRITNETLRYRLKGIIDDKMEQYRAKRLKTPQP